MSLNAFNQYFQLALFTKYLLFNQLFNSFIFDFQILFSHLSLILFEEFGKLIIMFHVLLKTIRQKYQNDQFHEYLVIQISIVIRKPYQFY